MKDKLIPLDGARLSNLTFGQLIKDTLASFATQPAGTITDAALKYYGTQLSAQDVLFEAAIVKERTNELTKKVERADKESDKAIASLFRSIKPFLTSDVAAEVDAAENLQTLFNLYKGLAQREYSAESNGIDNLVADLENAKHAPQVTLLGITRFVTRLKAANAAFKAVFVNRVANEAAEIYYDTKALRATLYETYSDVALYVQSLANIPNANKQFTKSLALLNATRKHYADQLARKEGIKEAQKEDKKEDKTTPAPENK
jgi:hypothetical protein